MTEWKLSSVDFVNSLFFWYVSIRNSLRSNNFVRELHRYLDLNRRQFAFRHPQDKENKGSDENTDKEVTGEVTGDHKNRTRICEHERCGNVRKCNAKSRLPEKISR